MGPGRSSPNSPEPGLKLLKLSKVEQKGMPAPVCYPCARARSLRLAYACVADDSVRSDLFGRKTKRGASAVAAKGKGELYLTYTTPAPGTWLRMMQPLRLPYKLPWRAF